MTMKKIYVKPFMKDHKLLQTNNLLGDASQNYDLNGGLPEPDPEEEPVNEGWSALRFNIHVII